MEEAQAAVITVPLPAQGHVNQMLQLSCLISSYNLPVHYVSSAVHNRQARLRINGLNSNHVSKIQFHDLPTPPFPSPPPNPNAANKFPSQLQPAWNAALQLRPPFAALLEDIANKLRRLVVVYDPMMAVVVQDVSRIFDAESYSFISISAISALSYVWAGVGGPDSFPVHHPRELPPFEGWITDEFAEFLELQSSAAAEDCSGDIYNTCRVVEGPYCNGSDRRC